MIITLVLTLILFLDSIFLALNHVIFTLFKTSNMLDPSLKVECKHEGPPPSLLMGPPHVLHTLATLVCA